MKMETKKIGGNIVEVKASDRNGVPVGIIAGYIATWDVDRGDFFGTKDQFVRGAFLDSIEEHRSSNRQIRFKDHHGRTVGGFPIANVMEDHIGLFGVGEINLNVQQGKEAHELAKQGVLSEFSIGFSVDESSIDEQSELRTIRKATIWEGSIVDEPMNPKAVVTEVKNKDTVKILPLADKNREWDEKSAIARLKEFTESNPGAYSHAVIGNDETTIHIADIVDGRMVAVPKAIIAAADSIKANKSLSDSDRDAAINNVERYYSKMNIESPFSQNDKQYFVADDVKDWTMRDLEKALRKSGSFSKPAAKLLAGKFDIKEIPDHNDDNEVNSDILNEIKSLQESLSKPIAV